MYLFSSCKPFHWPAAHTRVTDMHEWTATTTSSTTLASPSACQAQGTICSLQCLQLPFNFTYTYKHLWFLTISRQYRHTAISTSHWYKILEQNTNDKSTAGRFDPKVLVNCVQDGRHPVRSWQRPLARNVLQLIYHSVVSCSRISYQWNHLRNYEPLQHQFLHHMNGFGQCGVTLHAHNKDQNKHYIWHGCSGDQFSNFFVIEKADLTNLILALQSYKQL